MAKGKLQAHKYCEMEADLECTIREVALSAAKYVLNRVDLFSYTRHRELAVERFMAKWG